MKKILVLVILVCNISHNNAFAQFLFFKSYAQYVTIPDANFVKWLKKSGLKSCMKGSRLNITHKKVLGRKTINCSAKIISNIEGIQYFKNLDTLICNTNAVKSISALPPNIRYLDCSYNQLIHLPDTLPATLTYISCAYNELFRLPELPAALIVFHCEGNQLHALPSLLPPSLKYFNCGANRIGSLPALPATLLEFYCPANQLTILPSLPDSMYKLDIHNNPGLTCLPEIKKITNFYFYDTGVNCIPDYGQVGYSVPTITTIPLCSKSNPNNCDVKK